VIIFDEYQKRETVNLKTHITSNVFLDRNPRKKLRKDPVTVISTLNHSKINLEKDCTVNEELRTFLYMEIFKR
jgi:hypothetical protein